MGLFKEMKEQFWLEHIASTNEKNAHYYNAYVKDIEEKITETYEPVFENKKGENAINIFKMMTQYNQPLQLNEFGSFIDYVTDYEYILRIERFLDQYTYAMKDLKESDTVAYNWIMERINLIKKAYTTPSIPVDFSKRIYAIAMDNANKIEEEKKNDEAKPRTF